MLFGIYHSEISYRRIHSLDRTMLQILVNFLHFCHEVSCSESKILSVRGKISEKKGLKRVFVYFYKYITHEQDVPLILEKSESKTLLYILRRRKFVNFVTLCRRIRRKIMS